MKRLIIGVVIGAVIGGVGIYFLSCMGGVCPLTSNSWAGGILGGVIGFMIASITEK